MLARSVAAAASGQPSGGFSTTKTMSRVQLVDGTDRVIDTRTVRLNVDETSDLAERQELTVTWSGAHPTGGLAGDQNSALAAEQEYPVVLMECRGVDSPTAPAAQRLSPETCWTHTPQERYQSDLNFNYPPYRLDRYATAADRAPTVGVPSPLPAACASSGTGIQHWVPFLAADGTIYPGGLNGCAGIPPEAVNIEESLQPSNTTYAATDVAGNGTANFVVSTSETNASLGCSDTVPCSLVVIPIMGISCDPAGSGLASGDPVETLAYNQCAATGNFTPGELSPGTQNQEALAVSGDLWWSASNWRNRISVPLSFAPFPDACNQINKSAPTYLYGSELMAGATEQWSPAFCLNRKLFKIQHVQTGEPEAKNLLQAGAIEAAIQAVPPQTPFSNPTVEAPIGFSGFAISYAIDDASTQAYHQLKLTPRLLAKLLTESYPAAPAIRDAYPALQHNPLNIAVDPEFQALNPGIPPPSFYSIPAATLFALSSDSDVIWALTSYINADPAARAWLNGAPDPWGMVVNPNYKGIKLPVTDWPLLDTFNSGAAYDTSFNPCLAADPVPFLPLVASPVSTLATLTLNMQFGVAGSQVQCSDPGAPDQKLVGVGRETPGQRFLLGISSLADASRYRLDTAALQSQVSASAPTKFTNSEGRTFVAPDDSSLAAAAALLQQDPTAGTWTLPYNKFQTDTPAAGAYPGALLLSADVPTKGLSQTDAQHYATFLRFAATTGQTPGQGNGQLPDGFLPLTAGTGLGVQAQYTVTAAAAVAAQSGTVPPLTPAPAGPGTPAAGGTLPASAVTSAAGGNPGSTGSSVNGSGGGSSGGTSAGSPAGAGRSEPPGLAGTGAGSAKTATRFEPAASTGSSLAFGTGFAGLALPVALALAAAGGLAAFLVWRFRRVPP
jgi:hypothetical protein